MFFRAISNISPKIAVKLSACWIRGPVLLSFARSRHALSGRAIVNSEDPHFDDPRALAMLIDIFSERGFHAVVDKQILKIPQRVDLTTGLIECETRAVYRIRIQFKGSEIRRG